MSPDDRRLLAEAMALPCCIWVGFRLIGVGRTQALVRRWATGRNQRDTTGDGRLGIRNARRAQRIILRNTGVSRHCLVRSLTLWTMLQKRGIATDLRVGFRKRDGRVEGHAWLEYQGVPINESLAEAQSYIPYDQPVTFDLWRQIRRTRASHSGGD